MSFVPQGIPCGHDYNPKSLLGLLPIFGPDRHEGSDDASSTNSKADWLRRL
jgi:hypothetical protein